MDNIEKRFLRLYLSLSQSDRERCLAALNEYARADERARGLIKEGIDRSIGRINVGPMSSAVCQYCGK